MSKLTWKCMFCEHEFELKAVSYLDWDYNNEECPFCHQKQNPSAALKGIYLSEITSQEQIENVIRDAIERTTTDE